MYGGKRDDLEFVMEPKCTKQCRRPWIIGALLWLDMPRKFVSLGKVVSSLQINLSVFLNDREGIFRAFNWWKRCDSQPVLLLKG